MHESLSMSCLQLVFVYLQPFLCNILYVCLAAENRKKTLKPPIFGVQGHSRSLTLIPLKGMSLVLIIISSMSASICKCFHAAQANSSKTTTLGATLL